MKFYRFILTAAMLVSISAAVYAQTAQTAPASATTKKGEKADAPAAKQAAPSPASTPAAASAQTPQAATSTASGKKVVTVGKSTGKKPLRGMVINLTDYIAGGIGTVNAAQAAEASQRGAVLAFRLGMSKSGTIYLVSKSDGSSAAADLARLADNPVGIAGKTVSRGGMNLIIADVIDIMK